MILKSIKYSQFEGTPEAWHIRKFSVGKMNLIVGKNATGKTRTLNIINGFASLVSGDQKLKYNSGNYELDFEKGEKKIKYILKYEKFQITKEELIINEKQLLKRNVSGKGKIFAAKLNDMIDFEVANNELACVARRDPTQHPFFNDLYDWGKLTLHYPFGSQMGKNQLSGIDSNKTQEEELNLKNVNQVIEIFTAGLTKHGQKFVNQVKRDMKQIGYQLDDILFSTIPGKTDTGITVEFKGLAVKEKDLDGITNQLEISQGMFRVLSLVIQLNFSQLESTPTCILIDDIGEGLDYERSQSLIKLLMGKIEKSPAQLIMTTNDRFVMNNIPIEFWLIIERKGANCRILNYDNNKKIFDDFEYTGLSNFDFFTSDFYLKGFEKK